MTTHINTIVDYSLLWIQGVKAHFDAYGDNTFLELIYPKMQSLMEFCQSRTEEHGFLIGMERDWTFIDWADLDKEGPLGAEQMLFADCWRVMSDVSEKLGRQRETRLYRDRWRLLCQKIDQYYWDSDQGAYIDSFVSQNHHLSRHTNLFAILFGIADEERQGSIFRNVIENDAVPPITTPYFQFFALDALGQAGRLDTVLDSIRSYWGGMLKRGAVTFWEEFDPDVPETEQYDMYGDKFGKSLCHAWSASPIYLISRYFVGLRLSETEETDFILSPHLEYFQTLDCTLPVGARGDFVRVLWDGTLLSVETTCKRGVLRLGEDDYSISCGQTLQITMS